MATHPQGSLSERPEFNVVSSTRKSRKRSPTSTRARVISTFIALVGLGVALRFLPTGARNAHSNVKQVVVRATPADLQLTSIQMSKAVGGEALYLDGRVSNDGKAHVTGATVEVTFLNDQHQPIASVQQPLAGMPKGGVDAVGGEFAANPIGPNETRFFRVSVEQVPSAWNDEVPELKIVTVKGK